MIGILKFIANNIREKGMTMNSYEKEYGINPIFRGGNE